MKAQSDVRVLVVEDDPFFQRVLQKRMAAEGFQVMTASDGREGMKAIVTWEPDLVISDWMMPEVDGLELCQSVKTGLREAAPYFILLTAKGEISDRLLGLETGADDFLVKPCDQGELMARVRAGLRIVLLTQHLRKTVAELTASDAKAGGDPPTGIQAFCSECRRLRDADGTWMDLSEYLESTRGRALAKGRCPSCDSAADRPTTNDAAA